MAKLKVINFDLYRWRYAIGYFITVVAFVGLLIVASLYITGGLSEAERQTATQSTAFSLKHFTPMMAVDLPYYLLQKASIYLFGFTSLSIKLPSIILGALTAFGLLFLLRTWFRQNVAIFAALLCGTAGPFLPTTLSGTPSILYILWPTWILLSASMLTHNVRFRLLWKIILLAAIAMSLYTPLSIYILLPLIAVCFLHPHIRHTVTHLNKLRLSVALFIATALLAPLVYSIVSDRSVALTLLGIPLQIDILGNLGELRHQYLGFLKPSYGDINTPVYGLPLILIALAGLYRLITAKHTAKSYILVGWIILLIPIVLISPKLVSVSFVPILLLAGYGIELVITTWYRMFPKNPYARIAGLLPLSVLILGMTLSGVNRFVYGSLYQNAPNRMNSQDLTILQKELPKITKDSGQVALYVPSKEAGFYQAVKRHDKRFEKTDVVTTLDANAEIVIVSRDASEHPKADLDRILVNSSSNEADRFYVYKKQIK